MESNHRHSDYEPLALPLSYAAVLGTRVYLRTQAPAPRSGTGDSCEPGHRAGAGNRTPDPLLTMEVLCRLSYSSQRSRTRGRHVSTMPVSARITVARQ